jgi:regulatory protein
MSVITKMPAGRGREKRINVFLDDKFTFSLLAEVAAREGLRVGQELTEAQIEALTESDRFQRCLNAAWRFLGYRPRSEAEVRQRLQQHGYESELIEKVITRLKDQGLVDDDAFARFWIENRESFSPRSQRLTSLELQRKGLDGAVIARVTGEVDDGESAYRAALSKARRRLPSEYRDFRRRLGDHLRRRGFGYEVINKTVERVWRELNDHPE